MKRSNTPGAFEKRIHEIDFLRGALILLVILDHVCWFLKAYNSTWYSQTGIEFFNSVFKVFNFYWTSGTRKIVREFALFGFVFISGISCGFSRNNWKRAAQMLLVWGLLAIFSNLFQYLVWNPEQKDRSFYIDFNVIGVLAWCVLFYCFFQKWSWKGLTAVALFFFLIIINVIPVLLNSETIRNAYVPSMWYGEKYINGVPLAPADWMPLFPYIFYFFLGAVATKFLYKEKVSHFQRHEWERSICFVGRNTMWIYLGHEPLLLILFPLIGMIINAIC